MRLKVFNCDHPERPHGEVTACDCKPGQCPDYVSAGSLDTPETTALLPPPAVKPSITHTRHLAYIVYPRSNNHWWRRNVDQLKLRWPLFNGSKHMAVITDDTTDPADAVMEYVGDDSVRYLTFDNDPNLREVLAHNDLFESVLNAGADAAGHAIFFGHAKGVTKPYDTGVSIGHWIDIVYSSLLDYWPLVGDALYDHACAGSFKKLGAGFTGSESQWHYSGSFAWVRGRDIFARDWRRIDQTWWGTESWLSLHFPESDAAAVFKTLPVPAINLYKMRFMEKSILPEWKAWTSNNSTHRIAIG